MQTLKLRCRLTGETILFYSLTQYHLLILQKSLETQELSACDCCRGKKEN
uniref:Uncharacterized protein n=1 Tax=Arundo donax TaxID=35708 RepID=A0A0A9BIW3_ARUDO